MTGRLRAAVFATLIVLQALAVGLVVFVTGSSTRGLLVDEMRQTMALAAESLATRTLDHLDPAEVAAEQGADLIAQGTLDVDNDVDLLSYLDAVVATSPNITGAYVGRPDGTFVLVSRDGAELEGGTRVKSIRYLPDGTRLSSTIQRDAQRVVAVAAEDPADPFDPRQRPWYRAAEGSDGAAWTDPYVFFDSGEPGVTAASAARGDDGELMAVVGVDLSLRDLSAFVGTVSVSPASQAALVDRNGTMVAAGELDLVVVDDGEGGLRRATVAEVPDPVLTVALETTGATDLPEIDSGADTSAVVVPFEVDGRAWQAAASPLPAREPWVAVVAAPEDEFVNEVVDAQQRNALLAVAIGLFVVFLAVPPVLWLTRRLERSQERASTDALTGLPNRRRFDELVDEHLARAGELHPVSIAMIDVDLFKSVNDTYGHGAGDAVLAAIAGRLRAGLRDDDVVARIGGDEFAAILIDAPIGRAAEVLERARLDVAASPVHTDRGDVSTSVTIGVAPATAGEDRQRVLDAADAALYVAKDAGRNRVATPAGLVPRAGAIT